MSQLCVNDAKMYKASSMRVRAERRDKKDLRKP